MPHLSTAAADLSSAVPTASEAAESAAAQVMTAPPDRPLAHRR